MEVRLRYKKPDSDVSEKIVRTVTNSEIRENPSENFAFASAVAEFGLLLKDSQYKGTSSFGSVKNRAQSSIGRDEENYRSNFLELVDKAKYVMD
jgi:Ca-activated chloride channel family protein